MLGNLLTIFTHTDQNCHEVEQGRKEIMIESEGGTARVFLFVLRKPDPP